MVVHGKDLVLDIRVRLRQCEETEVLAPFVGAGDDAGVEHEVVDAGAELGGKVEGRDSVLASSAPEPRIFGVLIIGDARAWDWTGGRSRGRDCAMVLSLLGCKVAGMFDVGMQQEPSLEGGDCRV